MTEKKKIYCKYYIFKNGHCGKVTLESDGYVQRCTVNGDYTKCKNGELKD